MKYFRVFILVITGSLLTVPAFSRAAEQGRPERTKIVSHTFRPEQRPFSEERMNRLRLPAGFRINLFAKDLGHARMIAVAEDGTVYLTCPKQNRVLSLVDRDGDGRAEEVKTVLDNLEMVHGIALYGDRMYLAAPTRVWVVKREGDGTLGRPELIIRDLPDGGQHPNRTLAVGPDKMLYISVGSSCNACKESNPEHATILRTQLDGSGRTIFAQGLRNTIGFGWHPVTREMWGMDHGSDDRGDNLPPEELNRLREGRNYGWPYGFGQGQIDPIIGPPEKPKMSKEEYVKKTEPAVLIYQAHSAPIGLAFYDGNQFPERYRNGAFVAFRGSWNRYPATGYKVAFVRFQNGNPAVFEDFVTGFLIEGGRAHFGRLAGLAVARDGSLLFTDDTNGVMYRVSYASGGPGK